jgi:hypothetical protein
MGPTESHYGYYREGSLPSPLPVVMMMAKGVPVLVGSHSQNISSKVVLQSMRSFGGNDWGYLKSLVIRSIGGKVFQELVFGTAVGAFLESTKFSQHFSKFSAKVIALS